MAVSFVVEKSFYLRGMGLGIVKKGHTNYKHLFLSFVLYKYQTRENMLYVSAVYL